MATLHLCDAITGRCYSLTLTMQDAHECVLGCWCALPVARQAGRSSFHSLGEIFPDACSLHALHSGPGMKYECICGSNDTATTALLGSGTDRVAVNVNGLRHREAGSVDMGFRISGLRI